MGEYLVGGPRDGDDWRPWRYPTVQLLIALLIVGAGASLYWWM